MDPNKSILEHLDLTPIGLGKHVQYPSIRKFAVEGAFLRIVQDIQWVFFGRWLPRVY